MRTLGILLLALLLPGCATLSVARSTEQHSPRIVFTTGIEDDQPVDEIEALSGAQDRLCLSGRWFDLPRTTHAYRYELRDGEGKVIYVGEQEVSPTAATWFTYSCYSRTRADAAGTWTFTLRMGDFEHAGTIPVEVRYRKIAHPAGILGILKASDGKETVNVFGPGGLGLREAPPEDHTETAEEPIEQETTP